MLRFIFCKLLLISSSDKVAACLSCLNKSTAYVRTDIAKASCLSMLLCVFKKKDILELMLTHNLPNQRLFLSAFDTNRITPPQLFEVEYESNLYPLFYDLFIDSMQSSICRIYCSRSFFIFLLLTKYWFHSSSSIVLITALGALTCIFFKWFNSALTAVIFVAQCHVR